MRCQVITAPWRGKMLAVLTKMLGFSRGANEPVNHWKRSTSSSLFLSCFLDLLIMRKQCFKYNYFSPLLLTRSKQKIYYKELNLSFTRQRNYYFKFLSVQTIRTIRFSPSIIVIEEWIKRDNVLNKQTTILWGKSRPRAWILLCGFSERWKSTYCYSNSLWRYEMGLNWIVNLPSHVRKRDRARCIESYLASSVKCPLLFYHPDVYSDSLWRAAYNTRVECRKILL